ncbi:hypothetical protein ACLKA7_014170 [Drosophila subpalustris]
MGSSGHWHIPVKRHLQFVAQSVPFGAISKKQDCNAAEIRDEPSSCQDTETVTLGAALKEAAAPNEEKQEKEQHHQQQQQQQLREEQLRDIETKPTY